MAPPYGHHWRWEFEALSPTSTRVTETFDYHNTGSLKDAVKYYERMGFAKANATGIEATLTRLRDRYPRLSKPQKAMKRISSREYSWPGWFSARCFCVFSTRSSSSVPTIDSPHGQFR